MNRNHWIKWGILGGLLAAFGQGRFLLSAAIWVWPALLVRYVRTAPKRWALLGFVVAHTFALEFAYWGMVPLPTAAHVGMFTALSAVLGLVLLADRWIAARFDSLATTLVLPCGWTTYDYVTAVASPNGTWGSIAYVLVEQPLVAQVASVTGWLGLTFLVTWFAAMVNWMWERFESGRPARHGLVAIAVVFVTVLSFGGVRLASGRDLPTKKVALLTAPDTFQGEYIEQVWAYTRGVGQSEEDVDIARAQIADWQNTHFDMLEDAIAAGAELTAWAEVNAAVTEAEEASWIDRACETAMDTGAYVGLGLFVFRPASGLPSQNRFVLCDPNGKIVWDFEKATRVPGDHHSVGDGVLPRADTPLGRLTGAICFDMDFPRLIGQAGRMGADVLIAPSNDWTEVRFLHARMAIMRAIEQGFSLVRPTKDGISVVTDPFGRVLAQQDTNPDGADGVLITDVPTKGVTTVYARTGDAFAWAACAGFLIALMAGVIGAGRGVATSVVDAGLDA